MRVFSRFLYEEDYDWTEHLVSLWDSSNHKNRFPQVVARNVTPLGSSVLSGQPWSQALKYSPYLSWNLTQLSDKLFWSKATSHWCVPSIPLSWLNTGNEPLCTQRAAKAIYRLHNSSRLLALCIQQGLEEQPRSSSPFQMHTPDFFFGGGRWVDLGPLILQSPVLSRKD